MLTRDLLNEIFTYDPETGKLERRVPSPFDNGLRARIDASRYLHVRISDKVHQTHRVIWLMVYAHIPNGMAIDHINGDKSDNRLTNLRLASKIENSRNQRISKDNSLGFKGVSKVGGAFRSRINIEGGRENLGLFPTVEEAASAYDIAAIKHYGEFARTNKMMGLLPNTSSNV